MSLNLWTHGRNEVADMNFDNVLTNGLISDFVRERAEKTISSDELPLFVMNGDLTEILDALIAADQAKKLAKLNEAG